MVVSDVAIRAYFEVKKNQHFFSLCFNNPDSLSGYLWLNKKMMAYKEKQKGKLSGLIFQYNIFDTILFIDFAYITSLLKVCKLFQVRSLILSLYILSKYQAFCLSQSK